MQNAQCTLYSASDKFYLATAHIRNGKNSCNGPVVIIRTWENTRAKLSMCLASTKTICRGDIKVLHSVSDLLGDAC